MVTCPWCGTKYTARQATCDSCGGTLPLAADRAQAALAEGLRVPPPAPRQLPRNYVWRILLADAWAIAGAIFGLLGAVFGLVGGALTVSIVALVVGLPFVGLGLLFLGAGIPILIWRYGEAQAMGAVLRDGDVALGEIVSVYQSVYVRVNGRHPWNIAYQFEVSGRMVEGKVNTLSQPDLGQEPGQPVYVLYSQDDPRRNSIYPYPYGYHGL